MESIKNCIKITEKRKLKLKVGQRYVIGDVYYMFARVSTHDSKAYNFINLHNGESYWIQPISEEDIVLPCGIKEFNEELTFMSTE